MQFNKLKGKLKEMELSQDQVSNLLGISRQSFNAKINNKKQFTLGEVISLCEILNIDNPKDYFFTKDIPNMQQNHIQSQDRGNYENLHNNKTIY